MQSLRHKACLAGSSPCVCGQGVRQALAPAACILVRHKVPRPALHEADEARLRHSGNSNLSGRDRAAPSAGSGTSKSDIWESVRIVCDDGVVPASLEVLAMASPLLRSNIETALQSLAPTPIKEEDEDGCFSVAQPVELQMPGMSKREWRRLLQLLYLEVPRPRLDLDSLHELLPLAHKMGMSKLVHYLEAALQAQLPAALSMDPDDEGYMIKWVLLAEKLQLKKTKNICVDSVRPGKKLSSSYPPLRYALREMQTLSRDEVEELKQLSHGTLVELLMAALIVTRRGFPVTGAVRSLRATTYLEGKKEGHHGADLAGDLAQWGPSVGLSHTPAA